MYKISNILTDSASCTFETPATTDIPPVAVEEAKRFLSLLDGSGHTPFVFLAYPEADDSERLQAKQLVGSIDDSEFLASLTEMNQRGFAISVAVNETDGRGRRRENIKRIRAVWHEDDRGFAGSFPLEPSIVIETSPGKFHRYWLVEGDWPCDEEGEHDFARVMDSMVENFGSDPSARDASRVLRLPGSYHLKGKPHLVRIVEASNARYAPNEILQAFATKSEVSEIAVAAPTPSQEPLDRILEALDCIPADHREVWLRVGMALHNESGGSDEGFRIWDHWSRSSPQKYDEQDQVRTWKGFREPSNPVTIASVYASAASHSDAAIAPTEPSDVPETITLEKEPNPEDLADRCMVAVKERFTSYGHSPSDEMYAGLWEIAKAIQAMADGTPLPDFLVSFLPPGTGKTTVVIEAVKHLCKMPGYDSVGVIIFLERLEEIRKLVQEMGLSEDDYAVIVSKGKEENKLGRQDDKTHARVIFTTQMGLEYRGKDGKAFKDMTALHYMGKPRIVRVWDEAILPSVSLTLERWGIDALKSALAKNGYPNIALELEQFSDSIKEIPDNSLLQVLDIEPYGLAMEEVRNWCEGTDAKNSVEALWKLSGKTVRIRQEPMSGRTLLDYEDILPPDLAPMLILDASGLQRETYRYWHTYRKGLAFLKSAEKRYDGLTIHHWNRGAGRTAHRKDGKTIAQGVAKLINTGIPADEDVLIVHFKKGRRIPDMENLIREELVLRGGNVFFCNWGRHTATNDFASCKHVVLAGILQYPMPHNEAIGRGAKGIKAQEEFSDEDLVKTRLGEIAHNVFQAACRGYVRRSEEGSCPRDCHLYVVFSSDPKKGMPQGLLKKIFPGTRIIDWEPLPKELTGNKRKVADILISKPEVTNSEIKKLSGIDNLSYISRMRKDKDVIRTIKESTTKINEYPF